MTRARERSITLEMAEEAARRVVLYEIRHFKCAVRYARTGRERTRERRDRWHTLAAACALDLQEDGNRLIDLGLSEAALAILAGTGDRLGADRLRYLESRGLDPWLARSIGYAIESVASLGPDVPAPSAN